MTDLVPVGIAAITADCYQHYVSLIILQISMSVLFIMEYAEVTSFAITLTEVTRAIV